MMRSMKHVWIKHNFMLWWCKKVPEKLFNRKLLVFSWCAYSRLSCCVPVFKAQINRLLFLYTGFIIDITSDMKPNKVHPDNKALQRILCPGLAVIVIEWKICLRMGEGLVRIQQENKTSVQATVCNDMSASNVKHCTQLFKGWWILSTRWL